MRKKSLKFNNGKFKILVATDIHEKNPGDQKEKMNKTEDCLNFLDASVKALDPDLVVFNGDNVFGKTPEEVHEVVEKVTKTIREREIPLAVVLGNHEHDEGRVDPKLIMKMFCEYDKCLFRNDDDSITGYGNYYITLKGKNNKVKYNLWFMDSNGSADNCEYTDYDWVHDDQIEWYEKTSAALAEANGGKPVPALLFQHMPVTEIYDLLREAKSTELAGAVKGHHLFSTKSYVLKDGVEGYLGEGPCPPCYNNGQFDSWKKMGDIKGAFFGHDHINEFIGDIDGIKLVQCRGTGFNTYTDGNRTGVRLIILDEDNLPDFETKTYLFTDFGLESKSTPAIDKKLTKKQKEALSVATKIGAGVAAVTATAVVVSKIKKKNKR